MNVPNALSLLRLLLVPIFVVLFFADIPNAHRWAGLVFFLAAATDMLDGYLARRLNEITRLGRFLDPLADKLMTAAAIVCIIVDGIAPTWIFIVFAAKEFLMGIGAIVLFNKIADVMPSNIFGKLSTVVFFAVCLSVMLFELPKSTSYGLMVFALGLTLVAFVVYLFKAIMLLRVQKTAVEGNDLRKGK